MDRNERAWMFREMEKPTLPGAPTKDPKKMEKKLIHV